MSEEETQERVTHCTGDDSSIFPLHRRWHIAMVQVLLPLCSAPFIYHRNAYINLSRASTRNLSRVVKSAQVVYNLVEMDSHADTAVLGSNCVILNHTNQECDVSPYTDSYESIKGVPIVTHRGYRLDIK
jgi:hypothetical protein